MTLPIPQLTANDAKNAVGRSPAGKLTVTHIPNSTTDAIKSATVGVIARSLAAKTKKVDVLVILIEDPQL